MELEQIWRNVLLYGCSVCCRCACSRECNAVAFSRYCEFYRYVAVPPLLTSRFDDQTVVEGDAVSISCTASALPDPSYVFRKVSIYVYFATFVLVWFHYRSPSRVPKTAQEWLRLRKSLEKGKNSVVIFEAVFRHRLFWAWHVVCVSVLPVRLNCHVTISVISRVGYLLKML